MTRRWWGGPGISVVLHTALFVALIYVAAQPSQVGATAASVSPRLKFIYTVTPGPPGSGGASPDAGSPRMMRARDSAPVEIVPPRSITNVEPLPAAAVPVISAQDVDVLPGAPMAIDGTTVGGRSGSGAGGERGPGMGPGEGPGAGDVYTPGVGGVSDPKLISEVKPNYTADGIRARIQGLVTMEVEILANGSVDPRRIRITRSLDPGLDREAVIAVRQWRFRPSMRLGQPVASRVIVELAFTLR
jgi:periplasmic protein TonB